jgi:CBS domain-containing protein
MKKRTPVSKIMTTNPLSVNTNNSVRDVVEIFKNNNIHHLPVVSGDDLKGLISKSDIDRISFVSNSQGDKANTVVYDTLTIDQVMTTDLKTVDEDDQIREAAEMLANGNYHALPVLSDNKLKGIVTSTDIIKYLLEQF